MKFKKLLPLLMATITSCTQNTFAINRKVFCFDTMVDITLFEGNNDNLVDIDDICITYSNLSDNYRSISGVTNIYDINHTDEAIKIDDRLHQLLEKSFEVRDRGASNFNPLLGSLSKKWKEAIEAGTTLSQVVIDQELQKISDSSFDFVDDDKVQFTGEAELDLGGIAKGYTIDIIKEYLTEKEIKHYLVNGGSSSILLGEKKTDGGYFSVGIADLDRAYLRLKNTVISTSGNSTQGKHIVNPFTGQLADLYDSVIVISNEGYLGDALSTSLMMNTISEIQEIEASDHVQVIVIKDNTILYKNSELEVYYR